MNARQNRLETELFYEGGVKEFVKYLDRSKTSAMPEPIYMSRVSATISVSKSPCGGMTAITRHVLPFTNNIPQRDGGTHIAGFRGALTRTINNYAQTSGIAKKEKVSFTGDDAREGLDLCAVGQSPRSLNSRQPDQGQAGVIRSATLQSKV